MSCPDPLVLAAYAAGDLTALERRDAEVHLVRCKKCRAHVLGLREEGARAARAPQASDEPDTDHSGWGVAVGFLIALGAVALALAALGRASGSPLRLSGVYAMAFDLFFFVRGRAPGLVELVVALAATGTVAAIAALGVASLARRLGPPLSRRSRSAARSPRTPSTCGTPRARCASRPRRPWPAPSRPRRTRSRSTAASTATSS